jgi:hypothetical protein
MSKFTFRKVAAMSALAAVMVTASIDVLAAGPQRGQGMQRPRPAGVVTRETTRTRTDNGFTSHTTATNSQGQTATRDASVVRDANAGTITRSSESTGFGGRSRSAESVTTRTDNGFTRSGSITNGNGQTVTRDVVHTRTDNGSVTSSTTTGPNGNSVERTVTRNCDKAVKTCTTTVENERN